MDVLTAIVMLGQTYGSHFWFDKTGTIAINKWIWETQDGICIPYDSLRDAVFTALDVLQPVSGHVVP